MQLTNARVYIVGMGMISPLGRGVSQTADALRQARKGIRPLTLFPAEKILPVGEVSECLPDEDDVPRTHRLALLAAAEAMAGIPAIPDAVVIGGTTGGILTSEEYLKTNQPKPEQFTYHAVSSVAEYIARKFHCTGPVISVSTACSSGALAILIATEMLRTGKVKTVLAGGADSLCRLTYYGFNSLQLVDPAGARPFDKNRKGMNVSEGAAMLFLVAASQPPENVVAEILGGGLSCDAYHATAPHPEGKGAIQAMTAALHHAGISPSEIDYINLHGTGTIDNDLSEAKALRAIWGNTLPPVSSVKGAFGHSLAAAGANEAVLSALCIHDGFIPANSGYEEFDPALGVQPTMNLLANVKVNTVLSNSFGFGGNNASIVLGTPRKERHPIPLKPASSLSIIGFSCITGAGDTEQTLTALTNGRLCKGIVNMEAISENLPSRLVRRLKRLPRIVLSLALSACSGPPSSVFLGTGWGALSETHDFLKQLYETQERFVSPTDFVGSVHNAPAGQAAMLFKAAGPNITATVGDYSFDHALFIADTLMQTGNDRLLVIGADEFHSTLSPLFDASVMSDPTPSDGGGAVYLTRNPEDGQQKIMDSPCLKPFFFRYAFDNPDVMPALIRALGGVQGIHERFGAILAGIPAGFRTKGTRQLHGFLSESQIEPSAVPVIDYRKFLGEFASASASATVIAAAFVKNGKLPAPFCGHPSDVSLNGKGLLMLNLGDFVTAIEVVP